MPIVPVQKFVASKKLYAIDPASFEVQESSFTDPNTGVEYLSWHYTVKAVWFRKRSNGKLAAFIGLLGAGSTNRPNSNAKSTQWTFEDFIEGYNSARYGGHPYGCVDVEGGMWWSKEYSDDAAKRNVAAPFLTTMVANFPAAPAPFSGWFKLTEPWE